ncbi:hypothetical protein H249_0011 [Klebsiella pneumoniae VAKPC270]|nr:hypothetical protein H230_0930 [Klebsiella pneumoniae UHKPC09]EOY89595.1 hypothetical protein H235_0562 [Klebsiella pneumoniae UHKPC24]EOY89708.1 hypothetical protein H233_0417 [Klebsiella pneumoniae UHKPC27]EOZ40544.1 hypothetical protein H249_0011 [Klebsiella pneumoniae VAKPC270]EOZ51721.1 hypothetical protein H252_0050 [Klebsiella pneumoniae VAKPC309]EOZ94130.1 hypothetical protein J054_0507 [Klebsiella pneumoniae 646_1568]EPB11363.1 hypothetical protein H234_0515 [Klebsiella pneumoniae
MAATMELACRYQNFFRCVSAMAAKGLPPAVRHGERGCAEQKRSAKPAHKTSIIHIMK